MPTRRLAAIMFTDIAGYTQLMQQSEARANELRRRHREVFEHFHQTYNGQIVQYFGDGTLSTFDSCVEAVKCAIDMQTAFREEPKVPLRIGIHLGDIMWDDKDVMGDGVNLASRVESMGIPGSILISDDVNKQIKNQEIDTVSMGTFGMKNVDTPLEVFAVNREGIILPDPKNLKGKGKRLNHILQIRRLVQFASVGFVAMAIGALIFWASGAGERRQLLPESIREEKVAVSVFKNHTGDKGLNTLGFLASEWIGSGLRELKVRTVSPEMVRQNQDKIGILPDNPENKPSFVEITGAKYVVAGSYFLEGDSILLNTRLSSTETGEDIRTFPTIKGHKDQREKLVEEARQYLLGYWVLKKDQKLPNVNPPKYEAYQVYLTCLPTQTFCYQKAIDIDPNFYLARVLQMGSCVNTSEDSIFYADKAFIEKNWNTCTQFEKKWFEVGVNLWEGNEKAWMKAQEDLYQLDSNDYFTLHQAAFSNMAGNNMPQLAIEKFDRLFEQSYVFKDQIISWSYEHYIDALNRTKAYKKASDFYKSLSDDTKIKAGNIPALYAMRALIHQNRIEEVLEMIDERENKREDFIRAAYAYKYIYPDSINNPFFEGLNKHLQQFNTNTSSWEAYFLYFDFQSLASAYYVLGDWDKTEEVLKNMENLQKASFSQPFTKFPPNEYWIKLWHTTLLGSTYAHKEDLQEAENQIQLLAQLGELYDTKNAFFHRGSIPFLQARIYAVLGEKDTAVELLQQAADDGRPFAFWRFTFDLDFANLKGFPPFEELIAPNTK